MRLSLSGVCKEFGGNRVLHSLSLEVEDAHSVVLIGPSGGGKSTLLRILGGLEVPDAGEVVVNGEKLIFDETPLRKYRSTIGTVFQAFNLFPHLSALENITLPLERVHGIAPDEAVEVANAQLARFRLQAHATKRPGQMSGGQRQRVAIARALSINPRMLLFDEPTSALDPEMTAEVLGAIEELREEGRDLVIVTHHMAFARRVADHVAFLADGTILESGAATQVFDHPARAESREFFANVLRY